MITYDQNLEIRLACSEHDRRSAERLRYQVFVRELGGDGQLVDHQQQRERDRFDADATQLILVDRRRDRAAVDHVVGVYRMLDSAGATAAGQYYSETEYDLSVLHQSGRKLLELGRSCLHVDYRGGAALFMLWNGVADYVARHGIEVLFGVASFTGVDAKKYAPHLAYLYQNYLTPAELRVTARPPNYLAMNGPGADRAVVMRTLPPLIKAYLRIGGYVGDGAYVDHAFNTTDICMVLDVARMAARKRALYGAK